MKKRGIYPNGEPSVAAPVAETRANVHLAKRERKERGGDSSTSVARYERDK